jgi:RHS repeat-associated protein
VLVQGWLYVDGLRPAAELDGNGAVVSRFLYLGGERTPTVMIRGSVTYRIFPDLSGAPRLVVDSGTGNVVQRIDYDEFGNVLADSNPGFQPFGFGGGLYDRDTHMVRFGAREYDPETGRFATRDPLLFEAQDSNLYEYANSDPINFADPTGLASWAQIGQIGAGFAGGGIAGLAVGALGYTIGNFVGHGFSFRCFSTGDLFWAGASGLFGGMLSVWGASGTFSAALISGVSNVGQTFITNYANGRSTSGTDIGIAFGTGAIGGIVGGASTKTFGFDFGKDLSDIGNLLTPTSIARSIAGNTISNTDYLHLGRSCPCN